MSLKGGFVADFKIGYMQREIALTKCAVTGGTDESYDGRVGYGLGRLVHIANNADGYPVISAATGVTKSSIGNATHIIAQTDDSLRNVPGDAIPVELYSTRHRGILTNTVEGETTPVTNNEDHWKTVAVWKITNTDDIKIVALSE